MPPGAGEDSLGGGGETGQKDVLGHKSLGGLLAGGVGCAGKGPRLRK